MEELKLMRHHLGSIDLSDVDDDMTENERRAYCAAIHAVYPRLEKDIKKLIYAQLVYTTREASAWDKVMFGRGSIDGLAMLLENWRIAQEEHVQNSTVQEFDKHSPLGEV